MYLNQRIDQLLAVTESLTIFVTPLKSRPRGHQVTDSKDLLKMDYKLAAATEPAKDDNPLEALCRSTSVEADARQSELLSSLHPELKILGIRSHLLRGNLTEAQKKIGELENDDDEITRTEIALEKSRLAAFCGKWDDCLKLCNLGLSLKAPLITHLCLLQVRAVAFFEMGAFPQALNDSEMIISQEALLPQAVAINFSKAQRVKILLMMGNQNMAKASLGELWTTFSHGSYFNLDQLLVLLRLELEERRVMEKPHAQVAHACLRVARALGDRLYEGLALLDLMAALPKPDPILHKVSKNFENEFSRLRKLKEDCSQDTPETTTGRLLKKAFKEDVPIEQARKISQIIIGERKILVDLERKCTIDLSSSLHWLEQAAKLATTGIPKEEFFKSVWKMKYAPHLHDGVMRIFCHRQRKKFGLKLLSEGGRISLTETLVIC